MSRKGIFPQELAKKLLVLQQYFHSKTLTVEAVNQLVGTYVQSVEKFDSSQTNLRYYFVQKIQFLLSRPQIIELLSGNKNTNTRQTLHRMRDTVRGTVMPQVTFVNPVYDVKKKNKIQVQEEIKYDQELKKKQRSIKSQMYMDVQKQLKQQTPLLKAQIVNQKKVGQKIKGMISNQQDLIKERVKNLRNKKKQQRRKSVQKVKDQEIVLPQYEELKRMQQQIHDNITRFTMRQSIAQQPSALKEEPRTTVVRQTKKGGRITIRDDDD